MLVDSSLHGSWIIPRAVLDKHQEQRRHNYEAQRDQRVAQETRRALGMPVLPSSASATEDKSLDSSPYIVPTQRVTTMDHRTGCERVTDIPLVLSYLSYLSSLCSFSLS